MRPDGASTAAAFKRRSSALTRHSNHSFAFQTTTRFAMNFHLSIVHFSFAILNPPKFPKRSETKLIKSVGAQSSSEREVRRLPSFDAFEKR